MSDRSPWIPDPAGALAGLLAATSLRCTFANDTPAPPDWGLRERCIGEGHLLLVASGGVTYAVGGRPLTLRRGDAVLVAPGVAHSGWPDADAWPHIMTCRFACHRRGDDAVLTQLPRPFAAVIRPDAPAVFQGWMADLRRHFLAGTAFDRAACDALVLRLVATLGAAAAGRGRQVDAVIGNLCERLAADPARRWTLAAMAHETGLSRKMLLRRFRAATGVSPINWLIGRRLHRAAELLAETTQNVGEVAAALGYPDAFTFSRQFRRRFGHPPREHRQR
jgi:AraC-like DNA-binding protein